MALQPPTVAEFKARYPNLQGRSDELIGLLLQEATGAVDETWILADQKPAMLAYAAHLFAVEFTGAQNLTLPDGSTYTTGGPLSSVSVGPVSVSFASGESFANAQQYAATNGLSATDYGRRYLQLLRRNKPPVAVASAPVAVAGAIPGWSGWGW